MKTRHLYLISTCFFLSGLAGLIYETAWTSQLALVFGTSEQALVAVLAAYMGGLALGAALAGRWVERVRRPVLVYGLLELAIAVAALAVPAAVNTAGRLHAVLFRSAELPDAASAVSALFYLAASFAVLLVPTTLMGATLPLLARHAVRREAEIGPRIALLYGANTAGAATGTLAAAFLLLPRLGLGQTILAGAAVNFLVFLLAVLLARSSTPHTPESAATEPVTAREGRWILPIILVSGAVSFSWEILWTRLLAPLLGGTVYAFATMLASFLVALALGSALAAPLASSPERARRGFAGAQIAIAILSLAAFAAAGNLPDLAPHGLLLMSVAVAGLILPAALAIGATFPFAVRILARDADDTAQASARVFAWNTVGAITGSLLTGYFVLPWLRYAGTATAIALISLLLAAATAFAVRPRRPVFGAAALAGLLLLVVVRPATPWAVLRHSPLAAKPLPGRVDYFAVGRSATVLLTEHQGDWRLTTNGLPESTIPSPAQRPGRHVVARWLALLPLAARPETRSLLVVGLGAGITLEGLPDTVKSIHAVELEPEVIRANRLLAARRRRDPLADARLKLHVNDARGALRLTEQRFDAIVSQPSHPWTTGASHLYTREFFSLVHERLTPEGVFVQWMAYAFVDETLLRSLVATAAEVFPYVELYQPHPGSVLVLGSPRPLAVAASAGQALAAASGEWALQGVLCREDILAARLLDDDGARRFAREAPLNTDSRNFFRMRSPRVLRRPLGPAGAERLFADAGPSLAEDVDRSYLVRRLVRQGSVSRARRLAETFSDAVARHAALGFIELATGRRRPAEAALNRALSLDQNAGEALAALLALRESAISGGQPFVPRGAPEYQAIAEGWRLAGAGDWRGTRRLEPRLEGIGPRHPLYVAAVRLRVRWRIDSGDADLAREALDLLSPLLAPIPRARDLLLRARAGAATGEPRISLAAVSEALAHLRGPSANLVRDALRIVESLPEDEGTESWRSQLLQRLSPST